MFGIPLFLLPPESRIRLIEQERRAKQELLNRLTEKPLQKWSNSLKWAPELHIDAKSYDAFVPRLFDVPVSDVRSGKGAERFGDWGYQNVVLPKHEPLYTCLGARKGNVIFDGDVVIPRLWKHRYDEVWMSITPMEMLSQRPGFAKAKGRVMVGGLGMGWALREIASRKAVSRVTVVELSDDLLNWFGRSLVEKIASDSGKEIEIVTGDAFVVADERFSDHDSFIFDIWKGYGRARHDLRWKRLAARASRAGKSAWAWGASGAPDR